MCYSGRVLGSLFISYIFSRPSVNFSWFTFPRRRCEQNSKQNFLGHFPPVKGFNSHCRWDLYNFWRAATVPWRQRAQQEMTDGVGRDAGPCGPLAARWSPGHGRPAGSPRGWAAPGPAGPHRALPAGSAGRAVGRRDELPWWDIVGRKL